MKPRTYGFRSRSIPSQPRQQLFGDDAIGRDVGTATRPVEPAVRTLPAFSQDYRLQHATLLPSVVAITRLIITMPPRSLKSIAASVAFPAWLLGRKPNLRILAVSYAETPAEKMALDCMKVIESQWYREAFPGTRLARKRSARTDFETTRGGGRYSVSVNGALTGRGGDIIIIDDPHKPEDAMSDAKRNAVLDWYRSTLLTRLNDPVSGPIVLIQQRVHEGDLAGTLLETGGWVHLNLPAIAEGPMEIDLGPRGIRRREIGDLLHPERLPLALLDRRREELGYYVFAAQYQQRPAPLGGGLIKWDWFKTYDRQPVSVDGDQIVQSWDTASKAEQANDYSVCTTWLVRGPSAWLIDLHRAKHEFPQLCRLIQTHAREQKAGLVLIEEAGSGIQLIQALKAGSQVSIRGMIPKDDKATRMLGVTHLIEGGRIAIPKNAPWLAEFQHEVVHFPKGRHDDQVDSLSQFLRWLSEPKHTCGTIEIGF